MASVKAPKQATVEARQELQDIINTQKTQLTLSTGRVVNIPSIHFDAQNKIDDIILHHDIISKKVKNGDLSEIEGNIHTRRYFAKVTAAALLDGHFKIKLFWWIKWRIIYNFWKLNGEDYLRIISEVKKKGHQQEYYLAMALAMTMNDTCTMMTMKEAEVFQQELNSVKSQQQ